MTKPSLYPYPRLALVLFGFGLLLFHLSVGISIQIQSAFFIVSILLSGIPHGSLDHLIYHKNEELSGKPISKIFFLAFYHKYLFMYGLLWFLNPGIAILVFILISAYHFGELDWIWLGGNKNSLLSILSTVYGIALLGNMFLFHLSEMNQIVTSMQAFIAIDTQMLSDLYQNRYLFMFISMGSVLVLLVAYIIQNNIPERSILYALMQLSVLLLIILKLPLLLGFGFYFSCWHSILTIISFRDYLWGEKSNWKACIKNGLSNSFLAVAIIGLVVFLLGGHRDFNSMVSFMFIGIAVLTAPHMLVITRMFSHLGVKSS